MQVVASSRARCLNVSKYIPNYAISNPENLTGDRRRRLFTVLETKGEIDGKINGEAKEIAGKTLLEY